MPGKGPTAPGEPRCRRGTGIWFGDGSTGRSGRFSSRNQYTVVTQLRDGPVTFRETLLDGVVDVTYIFAHAARGSASDPRDTRHLAGGARPAGRGRDKLGGPVGARTARHPR